MKIKRGEFDDDNWCFGRRLGVPLCFHWRFFWGIGKSGRGGKKTGMGIRIGGG